MVWTEDLRALEKLARRGHYSCDDAFYNCPLAEFDYGEWAADCSQFSTKECGCGADEHNAEVDALMEKLLFE